MNFYFIQTNKTANSSSVHTTYHSFLSKKLQNALNNFRIGLCGFSSVFLLHSTKSPAPPPSSCLQPPLGLIHTHQIQNWFPHVFHAEIHIQSASRNPSPKKFLHGFSELLRKKVHHRNKKHETYYCRLHMEKPRI